MQGYTKRENYYVLSLNTPLFAYCRQAAGPESADGVREHIDVKQCVAGQPLSVILMTGGCLLCALQRRVLDPGRRILAAADCCPSIK